NALRRSRSDGGRASRQPHGLDDCPTAKTNGWPVDRNLPHSQRTESSARIVYFTCRSRAFHAARAGSTRNDQTGYWNRELSMRPARKHSQVTFSRRRPHDLATIHLLPFVLLDPQRLLYRTKVFQKSQIR